MNALSPIGAAAAGPVAGLFPEDPVLPTHAQDQNVQSSFGAMVSQGLAQVNDNLLTTQADLQALAMGDARNVHQTMIRLEEARLSFQLMLQVRGRLLEAYQDVLKMAI